MTSAEIEKAAQPLLGQWKCDPSKSEKFEEFLAEMGVNFLIRKMAKGGAPTMTISIEGGKLVVKTETGFMTRVSQNPMDGSEVEQEEGGMGQGSNSKSRLYMENGKLAISSIPVDPKLPKVITKREVNGTVLTQSEERAKKRALEKKRQSIRELIDSEESYLLSVLENLIKFKKTLEPILSEEGCRTLFINIEDLVLLTQGLLSELKSAIENAEQLNIGLSFVEHKFDFTAYAIYCTRLPKARAYYDYIISGADITLLNELVRVEQLANVESSRLYPGTYKPYTLKTLLHEPAVRCYRYTDLLKGIAKYCDDKTSLEYESLFLAVEVMTDINALCNICLRDRENLDVIVMAEAGMANINMGKAKSLRAYGRLRRYGKLVVEFPQDGEKYDRICFVFDKLFLITRKFNNHYIYERCLVLDKYNLGTASLSSEAATRNKKLISKHFQQTLEKYKTMFYLDAISNTTAPYCVKFFCTDERRRAEWISAITSAKNNTQPTGYRKNGYKFYMHSFEKAEDCDHCGKLMKGLFWQGYACAATNTVGHRQCLPALSNLPMTERRRQLLEPICQTIELPMPLDFSLVEGQSWKLTRTDKLKRSALYEKVRKHDEKKQMTKVKDVSEEELTHIPKRAFLKETLEGGKLTSLLALIEQDANKQTIVENELTSRPSRVMIDPRRSSVIDVEALKLNPEYSFEDQQKLMRSSQSAVEVRANAEGYTLDPQQISGRLGASQSCSFVNVDMLYNQTESHDVTWF